MRSSASMLAGPMQEKETSEAMASRKSLAFRPACKPRSVRPDGSARTGLAVPDERGQPSIWARASPRGSCSLPGTRKGRAAPRPRMGFVPAWPCSRRGLPGRRHCCRRRWSLTPPFHPYPTQRQALSLGRSFSVALSAGRPARVLPGAVLFGARTFLERHEPPAVARPAFRR